jgi:hypothetical protein
MHHKSESWDSIPIAGMVNPSFCSDHLVNVGFFRFFKTPRQMKGTAIDAYGKIHGLAFGVTLALRRGEKSGSFPNFSGKRCQFCEITFCLCINY